MSIYRVLRCCVLLKNKNLVCREMGWANYKQCALNIFHLSASTKVFHDSM